MSALTELTDGQITAALEAQGSARAAAGLLGVPYSTLWSEMKRRGISHVNEASVKTGLPTITREAFIAAMEPPNTCKVKQFLDKLDPDSRAVLEESMSYSPKDLSHQMLRETLLSLGFKDSDVPSAGSFADHRRGVRPCRCRD